MQGSESVPLGKSRCACQTVTMDYAGKSVFITGAAQGIGQALAVAMATKGCTIIGCDLRKDRQAETARQVAAAGGSYHAIKADLSKVEEAVAATGEAVSIGFDILINNAGIATSGEFETTDFSRWKATIDLNVIGLMAVTHTALPHLRTRPSAFIVNMSSIAGVIGSPGMQAYTASKYAVNGFTRCLEYDLADSAIGVTSIHPAMVKTRMTDGVGDMPNTALIEVDQVVEAILGAIEQDKPQVFVPKSVRWSFDIGSRIFPGLVRKMMRKDGMDSWKKANKGVPDG